MTEWKNITVAIMILTLCLNSSFILLDASGFTELIGVNIGLDQNIFAKFAENAQSTTTTPNNLGFSEMATIRLAQTISGMFNLGFALPNVLISLGVPKGITYFLTAPIYACFVISLVYYVTGRGT